MPRIIYRIPSSFVFFAITAFLFLLQLIPYTGIFLMFLAAAFWSVPLINAGMVGTAIEAMISRRVSRWWLVLPVTFYGVYIVLAVEQHAKLQDLTASNDVANASVSIGFDPLGQALVVEGEGIHTKLVQNYELPVTYVENSHFPEGYQSYRMVDMAICQKVRTSKPAFASSIYAPVIQDGDGLGKWEKRFCGLSMPEAPQLPVVRVSQKTTNTTEGLLAVSRTVTTATMPDSSQFRLVGGFASPLSWLPQPIMGCFLNDAKASWDCDAGFHAREKNAYSLGQRTIWPRHCHPSQSARAKTDRHCRSSRRRPIFGTGQDCRA